jgi:hypothetical protein
LLGDNFEAVNKNGVVDIAAVVVLNVVWFDWPSNGKDAVVRSEIAEDSKFVSESRVLREGTDNISLNDVKPLESWVVALVEEGGGVGPVTIWPDDIPNIAGLWSLVNARLLEKVWLPVAFWDIAALVLSSGKDCVTEVDGFRVTAALDIAVDLEANGELDIKASEVNICAGNDSSTAVEIIL